MRRLYYLSDRFEILTDVTSLLQKQSFGRWRVRILSKNESGLYNSHLSSTQIYQDNDMLHWGMLGSFVGGLCGLTIAILFKIIDPFDIPIPWFVLIIISGVCTCFGAWSGGLFGIAHQNYKTYRFTKKVDDGKHILLIDVNRREKKIVCKLLADNFPELKNLGEDSTLVHPFDLKFWKFFLKKAK